MSEMPDASGFSVGRAEDGWIRLTCHRADGEVQMGWMLTPKAAKWLLLQLAAAVFTDEKIEPAPDSKTGAL